MLQKYPKTVEYILKNPHLTFLFEIIYPINRIVVDYGDEEKLVLTGIIHTQDGTNYTVDSVPDLDIEYPRVFEGDLETLSEFENKKDEGFVVEFTNGGNIVLDRIKYKFSEYVRLHKIITECSTYSIFEAYKMDTIGELLEMVPDEFYDWVKIEVERIKTDYETKELNAKNILSSIQGLSRKEQAITLQKTKSYLPIVFAMIDGKDYKEIIYKKIKPEYRLFKETL
jgi:RNA ligase